MHYLLKHIPEDFQVEEIPIIDPKEEGSYLYVKLTKTNRELEDVLRELGKILQVPRKHIGIAGIKDKRAITTQYLTIANREILPKINIQGCTFEVVGRLQRPLVLGQLKGNQFIITLRGLERTLPMPKNYLINYYDEQRFSKHNANIGRALVKKQWQEAIKLLEKNSPQYKSPMKYYLRVKKNDYLGALKLVPKTILRLYLHAYPSYIFNAIASRYTAEKYPSKTIPWSMGELSFPQIMPENIDLPLLGFSVEIPKEAEQLIAKIMAEEGISYRDFIIPQFHNLSLEGSLRPLIVPVTDIRLEEAEPDDCFPGKIKQIVEFKLLKGCYATMFVKQWMHGL